jgi:hypothetical protein
MPQLSESSSFLDNEPKPMMSSVLGLVSKALFCSSVTAMVNSPPTYLSNDSTFTLEVVLEAVSDEFEVKSSGNDTFSQEAIKEQEKSRHNKNAASLCFLNRFTIRSFVVYYFINVSRETY